jgi:hypothetical protein
MKTYFIFAGLSYYPAGGWKDFKGQVNSLDEAKDKIIEELRDQDWYQVVEYTTKEDGTSTSEIVYKRGRL